MIAQSIFSRLSQAAGFEKVFRVGNYFSFAGGGVDSDTPELLFFHPMNSGYRFAVNPSFSVHCIATARHGAKILPSIVGSYAVNVVYLFWHWKTHAQKCYSMRLVCFPAYFERNVAPVVYISSRLSNKIRTAAFKASKRPRFWAISNVLFSSFHRNHVPIIAPTGGKYGH